MRTHFKKSFVFVGAVISLSLIVGGCMLYCARDWHQRWQKIKSLEAGAQKETSALREEERLQQLVAQQPLHFRNLLQRSINPPDREVCFKLIQKDKQITIHKVDFSQEKKLHSLEDYRLCQQTIKVKFVTLHDLYVVRWWDLLRDKFPGALTIKYIRMERALDKEGQHLKGEIECDWLYIVCSQPSS